MSDVNVWAVLASAVASMVIGSIWYGPLFGKIFMREIGMDKWTPERQAAEKKRMGVAYALQFAASVLMFYVLSSFFYDLGNLSVKSGVMVALCVWIGFVVPVKVGDMIWAGSKTLFWLSVGNMFFTLLAAGVIIGAWQ
jgi:hypothetical protein